MIQTFDLNIKYGSDNQPLGQRHGVPEEQLQPNEKQGVAELIEGGETFSKGAGKKKERKGQERGGKPRPPRP
jgi:hypothetical protein